MLIGQRDERPACLGAICDRIAFRATMLEAPDVEGRYVDKGFEPRLGNRRERTGEHELGLAARVLSE